MIFCVSLFIAFLTLSSSFLLFDDQASVSGKASGSTTGEVALVVGTGIPEINIHSPKNITYNFTKTDRENDNYTIDLNVSSDKPVDSWKYDLVDMKHNNIVEESKEFNPNTTLNAVRWKNKLIVNANTSGKVVNDSVVFFVYVPNSAPEIRNLSSEYYMCEGDYFSEKYRIKDVDEDEIETEITPKRLFYTNTQYTILEGEITIAEIFSGVMEKNNVGSYERVVSANDQYNSTCCVDTKQINISVIEKNNKPSIQNIGVKTLWRKGDNRSLNMNVSVDDIEDGNRTSENISFYLDFRESERLFNITNNGTINFTANENTSLGTHNITVCAKDSGINEPHENISSICNQDGGPREDCENFTLTITDRNRKPTIKSYYPENLTLNVSGDETIHFNITKYDPDGTIPDGYWFVDKEKKEYESENLTDYFSYSFGCGVTGEHNIKAEITDGLLNDSVEWKVNVDFVECPTPGGGGGGEPSCKEEWVCRGWSTCQNLEKSLETGNLSGEDYREVKRMCGERGWEEENCGVQLRDCEDLNNCNTTKNKPKEFSRCFYLESPSCNDGVKNCHDGSCELLVDCGGPCESCPTCSDGIQNQGEKGIDCGGPCPNPCPKKEPIKINWLLISIFLGIGIILIILFIIRVKKILKIKREMKKIK